MRGNGTIIYVNYSYKNFPVHNWVNTLHAESQQSSGSPFALDWLFWAATLYILTACIYFHTCRTIRSHRRCDRQRPLARNIFLCHVFFQIYPCLTEPKNETVVKIAQYCCCSSTVHPLMSALYTENLCFHWCRITWPRTVAIWVLGIFRIDHSKWPCELGELGRWADSENGEYNLTGPLKNNKNAARMQI